MNNPTSYTDYKTFYDANEPDSAEQLLNLHRSVTEVSNEGFFSTEKVHGKPNATHCVTASNGDTLILTTKSYPAFIKYIESRINDKDLGIENACTFERAIISEHS